MSGLKAMGQLSAPRPCRVASSLEFPAWFKMVNVILTRFRNAIEMRQPGYSFRAKGKGKRKA